MYIANPQVFKINKTNKFSQYKANSDLLTACIVDIIGTDGTFDE